MGTARAVDAAVDVDELVHRVHRHPLYDRIEDERGLRLLMRSHVFAVWDFQSLLKALQRAVTCVDVPWTPSADPEARRLVNEIVLDEESDVCPGGDHLSHFELYLRAMKESGADTRPIDALLAGLGAGMTTEVALRSCGTSEGVTRFVETTMDVARSGSAHRIAAAFSYGREDVIPEMFRKLVGRLVRVEPRCWSTFHYYLDRHVERDGDRHAPMARSLVARLVGDDPRRRTEAQQTARTCLESRLGLWDQVVLDLENET